MGSAHSPARHVTFNGFHLFSHRLFLLSSIRASMSQLEVYFPAQVVFLSYKEPQDFESTLKEVVQAKRLSASKMTKLKELATKLMTVCATRFWKDVILLIQSV